MSPTVLVVEDERDLMHLVCYHLEKEGYQVRQAYNGAAALALVQETSPDLVLLDLMLPDRSGFDICRAIKSCEKTQTIPILMLTARSSEGDRISGFEAGAEDYVIKPFSTKELMLRVKALLGRTKGPSRDIITCGQLTIHTDQHRVAVGEIDTPLTQIEFGILTTLARYPNVVKTREQILKAVWRDEAEEVLDRTVDAHVKRLRAKLGDARHYVETVRGIGYRLVIPPTLSLEIPRKPAYPNSNALNVLEWSF